MDSLKSPLVRMGLAVAVTAILVVVVRDRIDAADAEGWDKLAAARAGGSTTEGLEQVWRTIDGSSAEPWAAFFLAMQLYQEGEDMDRAHQVAETAIQAFPDHTTAPMLDKLIRALESYKPSA